MSHISLVTLGVDDLVRATTFYEALGWRRSSASVDGTVAFLTGGTVALALWGRDDLAEDARIEVAGRHTHGDIALAINLDSEASADALLASAAAAGARITKPAQRADWGGYSGYFQDPDGHLWEVAHNPSFARHPDGRIELPHDE